MLANSMTRNRTPQSDVPDKSFRIRDAQSADAAELCAIYGFHVVDGAGSFEEVAPATDEFRRRMENVSARGASLAGGGGARFDYRLLLCEPLPRALRLQIYRPNVGLRRSQLAASWSRPGAVEGSRRCLQAVGVLSDHGGRWRQSQRKCLETSCKGRFSDDRLRDEGRREIRTMDRCCLHAAVSWRLY